MTEPQTLSAYFTYCKLQKNLDNKTLKAYQIDLKQFVDFYPNPTTVTRTDMELYIEHLMERYKASTVKRKIAALKAYYHYLVYSKSYCLAGKKYFELGPNLLLSQRYHEISRLLGSWNIMYFCK